MPTRTTSRLDFIDAIRGVAACLVMLQHSLYHSGLLGPSANSFIPGKIELGETGVVAFFLVSGFVIPLSLDSTGSLKLFWIHRILRLYPLYIFIYALTLLIAVLSHGPTPHDLVADIIANLLFVQEYTHQENLVGGSWTLSLEMIWYLSLSLVYVCARTKQLMLMVVSSVAISIAAAFVCSRGYHLPMGRLSMLICCLVGLACYKYRYGMLAKRHFCGIMVVLIATIFCNILFGMRLYPGANPTSTFTMVIDSWALAGLVFFVPLVTSRASFWSHKVFSVLGRISYSIYLLHGVVLVLLGETGIAGVPLIALTVAVTVLVSLLTYRVIESPPIRLGKSLKRKNSGRAQNAVGGETAKPRPERRESWLRVPQHE